MRELLKDLLVGLFGAFLIELAPKAAVHLVRLAARAMPTPQLRVQMLNDWTAEVLCVEGNLQKLIAALWILVSVPNIRKGYGHSAIPRNLLKIFIDTLLRAGPLGAVASFLLVGSVMAFSMVLDRSNGDPSPWTFSILLLGLPYFVIFVRAYLRIAVGRRAAKK